MGGDTCLAILGATWSLAWSKEALSLPALRRLPRVLSFGCFEQDATLHGPQKTWWVMSSKP